MGKFSSSYPSRSAKKNSLTSHGKTPLEMCGFFPLGVADIHSDCFSRAVDIVPLNVIELIQKQRDVFDPVFVPSEIALGLLFPMVSDDEKSTLFEYCKGQFSIGFKEAIKRIRQQRQGGFTVVNHNGRINAEFTDEIQRNISLPPFAKLRDYEFRLRYGEELLLWANKYTDSIKNKGLKFSEYGNLILECQKKKIIYNEGPD
jgi:hypothetical protein